MFRTTELRSSRVRLSAGAGILSTLFCLGMPSAASAAGVLRTVDLGVKGVNMSMAAEANGDLHLAFRAGVGGVSELCDIRYAHYSASAGAWQLPTLLLASAASPCERGDGAQLVNGRVGENQPRVAVDPTTPGRAFVVFAGSPAVRTRPTLVQVDTSRTPGGAITRTVSLGGLAQEIKGVDVAVGPDGMVHVAQIHLQEDPDRNRIEVFRGASSGGNFSVEFATGRDGTGEGISINATGAAHPRVAGTFKRKLTLSQREGIERGEWLPEPQLYEVARNAGIRPAMGKLRFLPEGQSSPHQLAVVDALPDFVHPVGPFFHREVIVTELDGRAAQPQKPAVLHRYVFNNVPFEAGDPFSGEDINVADSPAGRVAIAYGIDGTLLAFRRDLAMVLTVPARTPWPASFLDTDKDGLDDRMSATSLDALPAGSLPGVFSGEDGRASVIIADAETPAVAFSGEKLWVAYLDQSVGRVRVSEFELPQVQQVPELGPLALGLCLLAWGLLLSRKGRNGGGVRSRAFAS